MVSAAEGGVTKIIESHPQDSRVTLPNTETVQTLASRMGTGGNNVPMVAMPVVCRASGQANAETLVNQAPTLHTLHEQPFVTVPICMATAQGNAEITEGIAPTITAAAGMSGNNQPMVTVPICLATGSKNAEITDGSVSPTLLARAGTGGGKCAYDCVPVAVDLFNGSITGGTTMTLTAGKSDSHHIPCALIPYTLKIRGGKEGGGRVL